MLSEITKTGWDIILTVVLLCDILLKFCTAVLQVLARSYYDKPQGFLSATVLATSAWQRLRDVSFQEESYEGEGLDEEKSLLLEVSWESLLLIRPQSLCQRQDSR